MYPRCRVFVGKTWGIHLRQGSFRPIIRNLIFLIKFLNQLKRRAKSLQEECLNPWALTTWTPWFWLDCNYKSRPILQGAPSLCFKARLSAKPLLRKFILKQIILVFTTKVSDLASFKMTIFGTRKWPIRLSFSVLWDNRSFYKTVNRRPYWSTNRIL